MNPPPIDPRLYNPSFRFRGKEIARILHCWGQGDSVLLTGIRRTGKTELLKAALYRYANQGFSVGLLDVMDYNSLPRFYQDLLELILSKMPPNLTAQLAGLLRSTVGIPDVLAQWVRKQINEINVGGVEAKLNPPSEQLLRYWQPLVAQLETLLADARTRGVVLPVIGIDELPCMMENLLREGVQAKEIELMLASLRKLRAAGLRTIVAGSISFENLLSLNGISHRVLGEFSRHSIPPFTREEAASFLRDALVGLAAGEDAAIALVLDTLPDYVPNFLSRDTIPYLMICKDLAACEASLHQEILPAIRRGFLHQFQERLDKNYHPQELQTAQQILDAIARGPAQGSRIDGTQLPPEHQRVLLKLQYDNFITDTTDFQWCFSLNLIRQWWRAQRGMP